MCAQMLTLACLLEKVEQIRMAMLDEREGNLTEIEFATFKNHRELQNTFQGFELAWREYRSYQPRVFWS